MNERCDVNSYTLPVYPCHMFGCPGAGCPTTYIVVFFC